MEEALPIPEWQLPERRGAWTKSLNQLRIGLVERRGSKGSYDFGAELERGCSLFVAGRFITYQWFG